MQKWKGVGPATLFRKLQLDLSGRLAINPAGFDGGDDGARTRDLCRDRAAL